MLAASGNLHSISRYKNYNVIVKSNKIKIIKSLGYRSPFDLYVFRSFKIPWLHHLIICYRSHYFQKGDVVECEIDEIGTIRNEIQ